MTATASGSVRCPDGSAVRPTRGRLDDEAVEAFEPDAKIALLATVDPGGLPRVSLITSLAAKAPRTLTFGQFCEGQSKRNLAQRPEAGFLVMTRDRRIWRGTARWQHAVTSGDDYEAYNRRPMFRYNAYFGIHTVHYLEASDVAGPERPGVSTLAAGAAGSLLLRATPRRRSGRTALSRWAAQLIARPTTLKFAAHIDEDGYPRITPLVPATTRDRGRLLLSVAGSGREISKLADETCVALLALNLQMESVLVRGALGPPTGLPGLHCRPLDVDFVYNSMPPKQGQIYPPRPLRAVERFA